MKYIICVDVGTTGVKTALFNEKLEVVASAVDEYELLFTGKEMIELDCETYIDKIISGINKIQSSAGVDKNDIVAVGMTSQGETVIPVSRDGSPLSNAIVWLDTRAKQEAQILSEKISFRKMYSTTGLESASPASTLAKLMWYKNNHPEIFKIGTTFLLLLNFLVYKFTGSISTDNVISASTNYFDINNDCYFDKALQAAGINKQYIPKDIIKSGDIAGHLSKEMADRLGLKQGIPVCSCGIDQSASAVGANNIEEGKLTVTIGTALVLAAVADKPVYDPDFPIYIARHYRDKYLYMPYSPCAGIILKWFKDNFCSEEIKRAEITGENVYSILGDIASSVEPNIKDPVLLPHFSGILSPIKDDSARGVLFGLTLDADKPAIVKAVMESVGYMVKDNLKKMEDHLKMDINEIYLLGGGSKSGVWCQMIADITNHRVITYTQEETTLLGTAIMTAVSAELIGSYQDGIALSVIPQKTYTADPKRLKVYEKLYEKYKDIYQALKPVFNKWQSDRN